METPQYHCPKCDRLLDWYGTAENGHGEGLWTMPDGSMACGVCSGMECTVGKVLHRLQDARERPTPDPGE